MLTTAAIYAFLKFWLPLASAFGLVIKGYTSLSNRAGRWAETLLSNHLHHVQLSLDGIQASTQATVDLLKQHNDTLTTILSNTEILKDRR